MKFFKTIIGILLIPVAISMGRTFGESILGISVFSDTLRMLERGILVYLLVHVLVFRPVCIYVLGHEFVHAVATWICGGHVLSFKVTPSGGNVVTSTTNFFIELSPYFVPIYTVLLGPIFFGLKTLGKEPPHMWDIFIFLVGFTLAFHIVMTVDALRLKQQDVQKSGFIFSFIPIFLGNLIIIMAVFCPIFSSISFIDFIKSSATRSYEMYSLIYSNAAEFINANKFW